MFIFVGVQIGLVACDGLLQACSDAVSLISREQYHSLISNYFYPSLGLFVSLTFGFLVTSFLLSWG
jgi:hypothetical protein